MVKNIKYEQIKSLIKNKNLSDYSIMQISRITRKQLAGYRAAISKSKNKKDNSKKRVLMQYANSLSSQERKSYLEALQKMGLCHISRRIESLNPNAVKPQKLSLLEYISSLNKKQIKAFYTLIESIAGIEAIRIYKGLESALQSPKTKAGESEISERASQLRKIIYRKTKPGMLPESEVRAEVIKMRDAGENYRDIYDALYSDASMPTIRRYIGHYTIGTYKNRKRIPGLI